jgi:type III restriction enzyme
VVAFFARQVLKELRLVGGYDVVYGKMKAFLRDHLFNPSPVELEDPVVLRNLSEPEVGKILFDSFKKAMNALTIEETGTCEIEDTIRLRDTRLFTTDPRPFLTVKKSVFNRIVGEPNSGGFELRFASFLDNIAKDVVSFTKNYFAVGFRIDYVKANGDLSTYTPDFVVKTTDGTVWIVETKGREELDVPQKMGRLRLWCQDATAASAGGGGPAYRFVYVDQPGFELHPPGSFAALVASFTEYQEG